MDGMITYLGLLLAGVYLMETPSFHRAKNVIDFGGTSHVIEKEMTPIPLPAWVLILDGLFVGISFGGMGVLKVLFLQEALSFSPQETGFALIGLAVVYVAQSLYLTPITQKFFGMYNTLMLGSMVCWASQLFIVVLPGTILPILSMYLDSAGSSLRMATAPALLSFHSDSSNRASLFSYSQVSQSIGRMIAPVIVGYLAEVDLRLWPFIFIAGCNMCSYAVVLFGKARDVEFHTQVRQNSGESFLAPSEDCISASFDQHPQGTVTSPTIAHRFASQETDERRRENNRNEEFFMREERSPNREGSSSPRASSKYGKWSSAFAKESGSFMGVRPDRSRSTSPRPRRNDPTPRRPYESYRTAKSEFKTDESKDSEQEV